MRYLVVFVLFLGSLGGCQENRQADPQSANRVIPPEQNGGHSGLLVTTSSLPGLLASATGVLASRNGCIVIDNRRTALTLVWPKGTVFDNERRNIVVTHHDGTHTAYEIGKWQTLPGGGFSPVDGSSGVYLPPSNPKCRGAGFAVSNAKLRAN